MAEPRSYVEMILLSEIEKALAAGQREVLAALDRVREATTLPQDPRVARELKIAAISAEVRAHLRGAA